jgi:hypothetical protein
MPLWTLSGLHVQVIPAVVCVRFALATGEKLHCLYVTAHCWKRYRTLKSYINIVVACALVHCYCSYHIKGVHTLNGNIRNYDLLIFQLDGLRWMCKPLFKYMLFWGRLFPNSARKRAKIMTHYHCY